jgi:hypothetical protein
MPNINDVPASEISTGPQNSSAPSSILSLSPSDIQTPEEFEKAKFGTPGQQALTVAEGLSQGFAGPLATGTESVLSKLGIPGLSPQEQEGRASANPAEHYGSQIAGFGAGVFTGSGEAAALSKVGEGAAELANLGEAAGTVSKIAATGIKTGSELAALQAGDEISKAINQDPNQTLGTAAINIGLSGILGGAGGTILGSVSPLFKTAANKIGITKLATDFMGELNLLQNPPADLGAAAEKEIADRKIEMEVLEGLNPEPGVNNIASKLSSRKRALGEGPFIPTYDEPIKNLFRPGAPLFDKERVKTFLDSTQKAADKTAKIAIENEAEPPMESILNPTPVLNSQTGRSPTPGQQLARWAFKKGADTLANAAGEAAAGTLGGIAGSLIGHPIIGALASEKILSPAFSALAKPFAEKAVNSEAMRASLDYVANAVKGDMVLSKAVKDFFSTGEIIPKFLLPTEASRDKLEKSLAASENTDHILNVGGNVGHYLPDHGSAAAALAAQATNYFSNLKPKQVPLSPFDADPPIDKAAQTNYNRALDIAQQPLLVLKLAKEGTLLPGDVQTLQTLYSGLHSSMVQKINNELIEQKSQKNAIPYHERVSLSMLTGSTLDSTLTPSSMQAIILSAGSQQQAVQANAKARKGKATEAQLNAIEKSQSLYATNLQKNEMKKT